MNSQRIKYLDYKNYLILLFGVLEKHYNQDPSDPLPNYSKEDSSGLQKVLEFCRNDEYYPTLVDKAAYLFVSIIENHYYSNGNKRLAFISLIYFLNINQFAIRQGRQGELKKLAIYVADKKKNANANFNELKSVVRQYIDKHIEDY